MSYTGISNQGLEDPTNGCEGGISQQDIERKGLYMLT
jgi:hypothetical protein